MEKGGPEGALERQGPDLEKLELPPRYVDQGRLARGGFAEIRRARDLMMQRDVAMKVLAWESMDSAGRRARFANEARITARLEHPGVVPVHEAGVLPDGRPFFTMKIVRGAPLDEVVRAQPHIGERAVRRRVVTMLLRVCETMAYAHRLGVVHRDLKPANIMVGAFGEVLVMDWGIARDPQSPAEERIGVASADLAESLTRSGDILGTIGYMAPEQARGASDEITPASDVWALGVILHELLSGRAVFEGPVAAVWARLVGGEEPVLPPEAGVPEELATIAARATRARAQERMTDAGELAASLQAWLDGDASRARAAVLVQRARALEPSADAARQTQSELLRAAQKQRALLSELDGDGARRPIWKLEDEAAAAGQEALLLDAERIELLRAALQEDAEHAPARRELARHYRARLLEAEDAERGPDAARYELLLRRYDRGENAEILAGRATLTLCTRQPARARLRRWVEVDRRLVAQAPIDLGTTPIVERAIESGSYLVELHAEGCVPVVHPVRIVRGAHWESRRPDSDEPVQVALPREGSIGPEDCFVPAGGVVLGGDALAAEAFERAEVWIDAFVMRRHPVTVREYLDFLDALARDGEIETAWRWAPRAPKGAQGESADVIAVRRGAQGAFELLPEQGVGEITEDCPVAGVSWLAARAYAAWYRRHTGAAWRLPSEHEWEKAARGADARFFPWGPTIEPGWARVLRSLPRPPGRVSVHRFETDVSPYGVRGLAGNVRDWCASLWGPEREMKTAVAPAPVDTAGDDDLLIIRGGAWHTVDAFARSACRFAAKASEHFPNVGFRLARSLEVSEIGG